MSSCCSAERSPTGAVKILLSLYVSRSAGMVSAGIFL
jgi:hypothetical protein